MSEETKKRKTVITISGTDGDMAVDVKTEFIPKLDTENEPPDSGWYRATSLLIGAISGMNGEHNKEITK